MTQRPIVFLSYGFRPFFLFAGIYAVVGMAAWMAWFGLGYTPSTDFPPSQWHAHEMLFGYATAALAGFLLTAAPNWTGAGPVRGGPLALLAGVWAAGRAAVWFSAFLPPVLVAAVDLAFPALLFAFMIGTLTGGQRASYHFSDRAGPVVHRQRHGALGAARLERQHRRRRTPPGF